MSTTAYFDETGKPRLLPSYCVFADFLGYRHAIKGAVERDEEASVFQEFISEIEPEIDKIINPGPHDDVPGFPRMWDAKVFTDNVVLGYALWSDDGEKEFGHAITQLMEFQYAVALKGFFVRGGWAIGKLFMNRNTVFGGPLLDAYDLESKTAVHPRIVLSEVMKELVFRHMARHGSDPPQCANLLTDDSGILFTNYLHEAVDYGEILWDDLFIHAELVAKRLEEHKDNQRVLPKFQWLAAYHNFFCQQLADCDEYSDKLMVSGDFPGFGLRRLLHEDSPYVAEVREQVRRKEEKLARLRRLHGGHASGGHQADQ